MRCKQGHEQVDTGEEEVIHAFVEKRHDKGQRAKAEIEGIDQMAQRHRQTVENPQDDPVTEPGVRAVGDEVSAGRPKGRASGGRRFGIVP